MLLLALHLIYTWLGPCFVHLVRSLVLFMVYAYFQIKILFLQSGGVQGFEDFLGSHAIEWCITNQAGALPSRLLLR